MQHMQRISTVSKLRRLFLTGVLCTAGVSFAASATVLTSTKPLGFIAAAITDGVTQTEVLLPDGASPHDYALRPSDVQKIRSASLVVWVGPDMEAFLSKPLAQVDESRKLLWLNGKLLSLCCQEVKTATIASMSMSMLLNLLIIKSMTTTTGIIMAVLICIFGCHQRLRSAQR